MLKDGIYMQGNHIADGRITSTQLCCDRRNVYEGLMMLHTEVEFSVPNLAGWACAETFCFKMNMMDLRALLNVIGTANVSSLNNLALSVEFKYAAKMYPHNSGIEVLSVKTTIGGVVLWAPKIEEESSNE